MGSFDVNALDSGVVNIVPVGAPATVVTTAANNTTFNGAAKVFAGAMEDIEYEVSMPPLLVDAVTAATGTLTVTFTVKDDLLFAGNTVATLGPFAAQGPGTTTAQAIKYYRIALPQGGVSIRATITITGAVGQITCGWVLGGKRINRTF